MTNSFGWGGLAPTLEPSLRGRLAYLFGHRYRRLPPPAKPESAAAFFRTAVEDSTADSVVHRLAEEELRRFTETQEK
jgi:hypothetical protein